AGVSIVFVPSVPEMYPIAQTITVALPEIANELCGASRPGHFNGVATVVLKLLHIVQPQTAVFGRKDFQQFFIIRTMVQQLNLPVAVIAGETMREADGLAMSSRNSYLSAAQRLEAPRLNSTLKQIVEAARKNYAEKNNADFHAIEAQAAQYLTQLGWIVDYIAI